MRPPNWRDDGWFFVFWIVLQIVGMTLYVLSRPVPSRYRVKFDRWWGFQNT